MVLFLTWVVGSSSFGYKLWKITQNKQQHMCSCLLCCLWTTKECPWYLRWVRQCHTPPMTGNGKHTIDKQMLTIPGGWFVYVLPCFTHINHPLIIYSSHHSSSLNHHQRWIITPDHSPCQRSSSPPGAESNSWRKPKVPKVGLPGSSRVVEIMGIMHAGKWGKITGKSWNLFLYFSGELWMGTRYTRMTPCQFMPKWPGIQPSWPSLHVAQLVLWWMRYLKNWAKRDIHLYQWGICPLPCLINIGYTLLGVFWRAAGAQQIDSFVTSDRSPGIFGSWVPCHIDA